MIPFGIVLIIFAIVGLIKNEEIDYNESTKQKVHRNLKVLGIIFALGLLFIIIGSCLRKSEPDIVKEKDTKSIEEKMKEDIKKNGHYIDDLIKK